MNSQTNSNNYEFSNPTSGDQTKRSDDEEEETSSVYENLEEYYNDVKRFAKTLQLPSSYWTLSKKEKRIIEYVKNFDRQFRNICLDRVRLFMIPLNEFNVRKFVCTTIQPNRVPFPQFIEWDGCAKFVASFMNFIPLNPAWETPKYLISPRVALRYQKGTCFEFSAILCSMLLGSGYDAYVVHGYAKKNICHRDLSKCLYPEHGPGKEKEDTKHIAVEKNQKYVIQPYQNLISNFEVKFEANRIKMERKLKAKDERLKKQKNKTVDSPATDRLYGQRVHSWILVLANKNEVKDSFFIEPLTGQRKPIRTVDYHGIEAVWNDTNYYVNMQDCSSGILEMNYDLGNPMHWEYVMPYGNYYAEIDDGLKSKQEFDSLVIGGNSTLNFGRYRSRSQERRRSSKEKKLSYSRKSSSPVGTTSKKTKSNLFRTKQMADIIDHCLLLGINESWCLPILISPEDLRKPYPNLKSEINYASVRVEKCCDEFNKNGLVEKIFEYKDKNRTKVKKEIRFFNKRSDFLVTYEIDYLKNWIKETFDQGDLVHHLKTYEHMEEVVHNSTPWITTFYHNNRVDCLSRREFRSLCLTEEYVKRSDKLKKKVVSYKVKEQTDHQLGGLSSGGIGGGGGLVFVQQKAPPQITLEVEKIIETYERNHEIPADSDIAEINYSISEDKIILTYHLDDYKIIPNKREFLKPTNFDDYQGKLCLHSDTFTEFNANIDARPLTKMEIYDLLSKLLRDEQNSILELKKAETESQRIVEQRFEIKDDEIFLIDQLMLEDAKNRRITIEKEFEQEMNREKENEYDYLAPYLQNKSVKRIDHDESVEIRERLMQDFRDSTIQRATSLQNQLDETVEHLRIKEQWYNLNQHFLTPSDEVDHKNFVLDSNFKINTLRKIIARHKIMLTTRYNDLEKKIREDKRLDFTVE